jgi:hypothetical protein
MLRLFRFQHQFVDTLRAWNQSLDQNSMVLLSSVLCFSNFYLVTWKILVEWSGPRFLLDIAFGELALLGRFWTGCDSVASATLSWVASAVLFWMYSLTVLPLFCWGCSFGFLLELRFQCLLGSCIDFVWLMKL